MIKFNTVLIPPPEIAKASIDFAQAHYVHNHDGYCLGSDGHLSHITLLQGKSENVEDIEILYNKIPSVLNEFSKPLELGDYYHHLDRGYCGLEVTLSDELKRLHEEIVDIYRDLNLEIYSGHGDDYWPHLTFAKTSHELSLDTKIPNILQGQSNGWRLEFGYRGDHGVYLGKYKPKCA